MDREYDELDIAIDNAKDFGNVVCGVLDGHPLLHRITSILKVRYELSSSEIADLAQTSITAVRLTIRNNRDLFTAVSNGRGKSTTYKLKE